MTTYSDVGQTTQASVWPDGAYDQPDLVLLSCDTCGAVVAHPHRDLHAATHDAA